MKKLVLLMGLLAAGCAREVVYVVIPDSPEPEQARVLITTMLEPEPEITFIEAIQEPDIVSAQAIQETCTGTSPEDPKFKEAVLLFYVTYNRGCGDIEFMEAQPLPNPTWGLISRNIYRDYGKIYIELEKLQRYHELPTEFEDLFCDVR